MEAKNLSHVENRIVVIRAWKGHWGGRNGEKMAEGFWNAVG
jgi:hypothetical protein